MSVHVTSAVWKHSEATGNRRLVLLKLADQANDGGWCWPAQDESGVEGRVGGMLIDTGRKKRGSIALECRVSRSTVGRCIDWLEEKGELEVFQHPKQRGRRLLYRVTLGADLEIDRPDWFLAYSMRQIDTSQDDPSDASTETPAMGQDDASHASLVTHTIDKEPSKKPTSNLGPSECHQLGCDKGKGHAGVHRVPWWEELVELFGYTPADTEAGLFGVIVKRCRELELDPAEVKRRAAVYTVAFDDAPLTVAAFVRHWDWLGSTLAQADPVTKREYAEALRRLERRQRLRGGEDERDGLTQRELTTGDRP